MALTLMNEEKNFDPTLEAGPVTPPPAPDVRNARRREVCNPGVEYDFAYGQGAQDGCGTDSRRNPFAPDNAMWGNREPSQGTNGMGVAGFVLALVSVFGTWLPFVGGLTWLLGLVFSCIGLTRRPRGLAVAGLIISLVWLLLWLVLVIFVGVMWVHDMGAMD